MGLQLDIRAIFDPSIDPGVRGAAEVLRFAGALVADGDALTSAREALCAEIGPLGVGAISATIGNFEMMNRVVDATGVPTP